MTQRGSDVLGRNRWRLEVVWLSCVFLGMWGGGCAPGAPAAGVEAPSAVPTREELDRALLDYDEDSRGGGSRPSAADGAPTRVLDEPRSPTPRFAIKRIVTPEPPPLHVGTRRRIDVKLRRADLQEALRFLAHAGGFNLVIGEGVAGEVTAELTRVTPYDALQVIARAHGARVVHTRPSGGSSIVLVEPDR